MNLRNRNPLSSAWALALAATVLVTGCGEDPTIGGLIQNREVESEDPILSGAAPDLAQRPSFDLEGRFASNAALQQDTFAQEAVRAVDILWVVDNSGSMAQEQEKLRANFRQFIKFLNDNNVDFHIGVVTTDTATTTAGQLTRTTVGAAQVSFLTKEICDTQSDGCQALFAGLSSVGTDGSPVETPFDAAAIALTEPVISSPTNNGFLRDEANLAIIIVTDEIDSSTYADVTYYARLFDGLKSYGNGDEVTFSAIAGGNPATNQVAACVSENPDTGPLSFVGDPCPGGVNGGCPSNSFCLEAGSAGGVPTAVCSKTCTPFVPGECPTNYTCLQIANLQNACVPDAIADGDPRIGNLVNLVGGVFSSICASDFTTTLEGLGFTVAGLKQEFELSREPRAESINVRVTGASAVVDPYRQACPDQTYAKCSETVTTWCYDAAKNAVRFTDDCRPPENTTVEIRYRVRS